MLWGSFTFSNKTKNMFSRDIYYMYRAVRASLYCNIVLVIIKITALLIVNSLAIAVDLGISFVGLIVSVILLYSIKLSNKPADLIHNYGYGKVEHVCEALEGVVLIGIALAMSAQAIAGMLHPAHITLPWVGFGSSGLNALINFVGSLYIFKMAKKSNSPAIHAEGLHYRLEGFISGIIACSFVISIVLSKRGYGNVALYVDPFAALIVSLVVIIPSFKLAKSSFFKLLDASVEEGSQLEIFKKLSVYINRFCEYKDLKTRTAGRKKFVEFKLVVPARITLRQGHQLVGGLEQEIKEAIKNSEVTIKMEPCLLDCNFEKNHEKCPYLSDVERAEGEL